MTIYTVSVDSTGYSADWNDVLIVAAESREEAEGLASEWAKDRHTGGLGIPEISSVEAHPYAGSARVLGPLDMEG